MIDNYFWNTRGGCVQIFNEQAARAALNNGFVRLSEEERTRFKPGSYHPGHDMGDQAYIHVAQPQHNAPVETQITDFWSQVIEI